MCVILLTYIDIGNARVAGMQEDLKLQGTQFEWLLTAFYLYVTKDIFIGAGSGFFTDNALFIQDVYQFHMAAYAVS